MKQAISMYDFERAFVGMNRKENFSYLGKKALFEYLEDLAESTGEEIELDVIALCCEFTEYEDLDEFHCNYDKRRYPDLDTLRDYTQVIEFEEGFIIQNF